MQISSAYYQERSASQALAGGAYQEAIARFERALDLLGGSAERGDAVEGRSASRLLRMVNPLARTLAHGTRVRRGVLEAGVSEAYYRLGDLRRCEQHAALALTTLGLGLPRNGTG